MAIVRTYQCECGCTFDKLHFSRDEPPPDCPRCSAPGERQSKMPTSAAIIGTHSKALDITQEILEKDYGMSDIRDNLRAGDIAAPPLRADLQKQVGEAFKNSGPIIAQARAGAQAAASEGRNPFRMIQGANKRLGSSRVRVNPVARG